ncbi:MAG TPA: hypothetical protein VHV82_08305 [Sporichthyaceae bacterium]|jgi:hypothetical protein|nr:hypothetical protein [Sporichthyaceae bacterium]
MSAAASVCVGPLDPVCSAVGGVAGSVAQAGSGFVLDGLGQAFVNAAQSVTGTALTAIDSGTRIDLTASWFRANIAVIAAVTLPVVTGLLVAQVVGSVLRREPGGLLRAVVGLGKAFVGAGLALAVTQAALVATDGICQFIAASAGTTVHGAAQRFLGLSWLAGPTTGPVLQMLLGIGIIVGCLALWLVLLFRKAALLLVAVFAPIAFAGAVWDHTRVWTRRWIEIVAALVACKIVIVVTFVLGAAAFSGTSPSTPPSDGTSAVPVAAQSGGLSDVLVGLLLLAIACFAPWLTFRFVHWSGMEAASAMHANVAANPASRAAGATASQARFATQHALTTAVLNGTVARGGAGRSAGPGGPGATPVPPAQRPAPGREQHRTHGEDR